MSERVELSERQLDVLLDFDLDDEQPNVRYLGVEGPWVLRALRAMATKGLVEEYGNKSFMLTPAGRRWLSIREVVGTRETHEPT